MIFNKPYFRITMNERVIDNGSKEALNSKWESSLRHKKIRRKLEAGQQGNRVYKELYSHNDTKAKGS